MPVLTGPALAIAALIVLAAAQKLLDPTMTVGALRAMDLPSAPLLVRAGSMAELALGMAAIVIGGPATWGLVAITYVVFAAFVSAALRKGTMIGSCGCFGREETPPHPAHVVLNLVLATTAGVIALGDAPAPIDALIENPGVGAALVAVALVAVVLLYATFVELPRTLAAARPDGR